MLALVEAGAGGWPAGIGAGSIRRFKLSIQQSCAGCPGG